MRNFVWKNLGDGKCSSESKAPQKTGEQGRSDSKGRHSFWIFSVIYNDRPLNWVVVEREVCLPLIGSRYVSRRVGLRYFRTVIVFLETGNFVLRAVVLRQGRS